MLSVLTFAQMIGAIDPRRTAREIDLMYLEAVELSSSPVRGAVGGGGSAGGDDPTAPLADVILEDAWLQIARTHNLRPNGGGLKDLTAAFRESRRASFSGAGAPTGPHATKGKRRPSVPDGKDARRGSALDPVQAAAAAAAAAVM